MLDVLNRYAHGFVAVPVILACRRGGIVGALSAGPHTAHEIAAKLRGNSGHILVALRMLESIGWLDSDNDGRFTATPDFAKQALLPAEASKLYDLDMERYLRQGDGGALEPWIARIAGRWNLDEPLLADFLDSTVVVPVLATLSKLGLLRGSIAEALAALPPAVGEEVAALFATKGWLEGGRQPPVPTAPGRFFFERAMNLGVAASYRPMLAAIDQLLFGAAAEVFAHDADGAETHVDRSMNVLGSGFMHGRYFAEVEEILISIFGREPFADQPRYVADMGCGDGTFLKRVYETVRDKTPRGKRLEEFPLTLVGIDLNHAALAETSKTLAGIDHVVVHGDIGRPAAVVDALRSIGVDPEQVLHIRSFLDHDRPYIAPSDSVALAERSRARLIGAYVDREGAAIPAAAAVQSLVEHLERWAGVVTPHGLILLEVHCQDPRVVRRYLDQSESLYFDAIQGFSQQLLIEADVALMAAAEAGLFPRHEYFRKFPSLLPYCRITLGLLERRPYRVRPARATDLPALLRLEEACWAEPMRVTSEELLRRIRTYPSGQWVIELDGAVVGVVYSQRVRSVDELATARFVDLPALHDENGAVVQLIAINVLPETQHLSLGDELLNLMLLRSSVQGGVERVAGITRCREFRGRTEDELRAYIETRDDAGRPIDPILKFHHSHGAQFRGAVPNFRPEDRDNLGAGVLLCYELTAASAAGGAAAATADAGGPDTAARLEACLKGLLGPKRAAAFSWQKPLRDMGLDSLDLLELRTLLQQTFKQPLSPTFFFAHPTLRAIEQYFARAPEAGAAGGALRENGRPRLERRMPQDTVKAAAPAGGVAHEPIAVVGMAGRFPASADIEEYWQLLRRGGNAITAVPAERWDAEALYSADPEAPGRIVTRLGGFLPLVDRFDAPFFGISRREANLMDPQQRLLLELHWEALEQAGVDPNVLRERACGIFVGLYSHDYELLLATASADRDLDAYYATGNAASIAAGRLAYFFGTRGPALTLDTACSSSLVAVHQAIRSLRSGECEVAFASGVNLMLSPRPSIMFSRAGMLSPHGRCATFDSSADGYVRSEGCGVVLLKRLADARRDGDRVLAVLRGSAVNQDGASNGLTAPSLPAQAELLRNALADAGLRPAEIDYVEAHGTGTSLGDPVEFHALREVFGGDAERRAPLWIGSVKTNIGHAEAAAGIAGLIKVIASMRHGWLPAHLHFRAPNPEIDLASLPARIPVEGVVWQGADAPLRCGVSSFGFSGTNAHVIVEQAPEDSSAAATPRASHVLPLSAKSGEALATLAARVGAWLDAHPNASVAEVCHTAGAGRAHHGCRVAVAAGSAQELREALRRRERELGDRVPAGGPPRVAFLFTGQGSQYVGMAEELASTEPAFRDALAECREWLLDELEQPLERLLYASDADGAALDETANTQPALFAVEYALARMLEAWGVRPAAVLGHSVGEYVAACIAGVLEPRDAIKLIAARGRLMGSLPRDGAMLAVLAPRALVERAVANAASGVDIAAFNGPENVVVSGERDAVAEIGRTLEQAGAKVVPLQVSHAFHSRLMEPILPDFAAVVRGVRLSRARLPLISNVSGSLAGDEITQPDYWTRHLRRPVEFERGILTLLDQGVDAILEVGPHPVLSSMGRLAAGGRAGDVQWLHTLAKGAPDWDGIAAALAVLYERGAEIDWHAVDAGLGAGKVSLPGYPWARQRYWFDGTAAPAAASAPATPVLRDACYEVRWVPQPQAAAAADPHLTGPPGFWALLADSTGVAEALRAALEARGDDCVLVRPTGRYDGRIGAEATLDPLDPDDYERLLAACTRHAGDAFRGVLHLFSLDVGAPAVFTAEALHGAQRLGADSLLLLAQAAARAQTTAKVWLVTRGAQAVDGDATRLAIAQAPAWGLARVAALEHPEIWGGAIDLPPTAAADDAGRLLEALAAGGAEDQIAIRSGRLVPRLVRAADPAEGSVRLGAGGCYLVTGGLGKLGLRLAEWLVRHGARHVVLTGRKPLPARERWDELPPDAPERQAMTAIAMLEREGATILTAAVDVADRQGMAALFARFGADLPQLRGIVHAAGLIDMRPLAELDLATLDRVRRAKLEGAWILHELSQPAALDFFAMFSSAASVWGAGGFAHYAAANHFLDALAHYRSARGLPATVVNWGWWQGGGSSADANESFEHFGVEAMPVEAALATFGRLLAARCTQRVVAAVDWQVFKPLYEARRERPFLEALGPRGEPARGAPTDAFADGRAQSSVFERLRAAPADEREPLMEDYVTEQVAAVLHAGKDELHDRTRGFFKLGMDSMMSVQLCRLLEKDLGRKLPGTIAFQYPTIRALAAFLLAEIGMMPAAAGDGVRPAAQPAAAGTDDAQDLDALEEAELASVLDEALARVLRRD